MPFGDQNPVTDNRSKWRRHIFAASLFFFFTVLLSLAGLLISFDHFILDKRFKVLSHSVKSDAVIVAIDTKSLQAMPDWPWSRSVHGNLLQIVSAAGAKSVAFDIDFSAPGDPAGNQAFADAIDVAKTPVFLAALRQPISADMPNVTAEIQPHPQLLAHSQIAGVNYPIDQDGILRRAIDSVEFSFGRTATLATKMAGKQPDGREYYIDFSISPRSFERISYSDVLLGDFDKEVFRNKNVLVGATALELGDEFAIPVYGVQSGVLVNATTYETARRDRELTLIGVVPTLLFTALLCLVLTSAVCHNNPLRCFILNALILAAIIVGPLPIQAGAGDIIYTASLHLAQFLCIVYVICLELERRTKQAFYARMEAKDSYTLLQTLIADNHEGFIVVNRYGALELCNPRAQEMLGLEKPPIAGVHLRDVEPALAAHLAFSQDETGVIARFTLEKEIEETAVPSALDVTVSRSRVFLADSSFERRKNDRIFVVFALHDITAQKKAEHAERAAKDSHAEISAAKTQLISNMNHELRTPLNSVIGFADVLKSETLGPLGNEQYCDYADMIGSSGRHLLSILNNMLHAAQLQAGEKNIYPDTVIPAELFEEAMAETKGKKSWSEQQVVVLVHEVIEKITVDWSLMKLALVHLLDNAAKFAGPKAIIELTATTGNGQLKLIVTDNGPGCPAGKLPDLTEIFNQADAALNRNFEGCGLGLYLVTKIVDLHSGSLALLSDESGGFTVEITLPAACVTTSVHDAA